MRDFFDDEEVRRVYYPEVERASEAGDRCRTASISSITRAPARDGREDRSGAPRQPVQRVHIDHTASSGPQRVRDLLPDEADGLLKGRVQVINLWRPIRGRCRIRRSRYATPDHRPEDLVPSDLVYPNRVGETYSVKFDPAHRWYYVPQMRADEALLLKCYGHQDRWPARFTPHSAFIDPTTPADAPPRESIEVRALVFHRSLERGRPARS